ncbi:hypothetical protein HNQ85_003565 [Anoxybacillus calidus]|uniref:Uncharacterized protein n=1 Tax=[Anoxybacillus] calidus TaxID=575178 RepID=A0A7W0BYA4_9BACL|nr:hypothetical protein [Anoxybacillus calidus]
MRIVDLYTGIIVGWYIDTQMMKKLVIKAKRKQEGESFIIQTSMSLMTISNCYRGAFSTEYVEMWEVLRQRS